MAASVVPSLEAGKVTDQAVSELRESALRSRFWQTRFGDWLLKEVLEELAGAVVYEALWQGDAGGTARLRLLGSRRVGDRGDRDSRRSLQNAPRLHPVATISGTVGHLEDLNSLWSVAVVAVIAITAFDAVSRDDVSRATKPVLRVKGFKSTMAGRWFSSRLRWSR